MAKKRRDSQTLPPVGKTEGATSGATTLPIELFGAEDVQMTYADAVFVNYSFDDISVAFFQTLRKVPRNAQEATESVSTLPARCVSRVVLSPRVAALLHNWLEINIRQREAAIQQLQNKQEPKDQS